MGRTKSATRRAGLRSYKSNRRTRIISALFALALPLISACGSNGCGVEQPSRRPETVEQGKREMTVDLVAHTTQRQASCDLRDMLNEAKPDAIFLELMVTTHEMAKRDMEKLNSGRTDVLSPTESQKLAQAYILYSDGTTIYYAESYSPEELDGIIRSKRERKRVRKGDGSAIDDLREYTESTRMLARDYVERNERIAETIIGTKFKKGTLSVGDAHEHVVRLLREAGIRVIEFKNLDYAGPLTLYYMEVEKGWRKLDKAEEERIAVHSLIASRVAREYERRGLKGRGRTIDHMRMVARRSIPEGVLGSSDLVELYVRGCRIDMIDCLMDLGIPVPETRAEIGAVLLEAGIHGCR